MRCWLPRLLILLTLAAMAASAGAQPLDQPAPPAAEKSLRKAFGLSLLVPGLGHRYAHDGHWSRGATFFAAAEASLWLGILGSAWQRDYLIDSYETLAASRADAAIAGKSRRFFLNLATYRSSDEYLEAQLRNRNWDDLDYVDDPAFRWQWATEEDFATFRDRREQAESVRRRQSLLATMLVANRLLAALTAVRAVNRATRDAEAALSVHLSPAPDGTNRPMLNLGVRW